VLKVLYLLSKKGELLNQEPNITEFDKSEICLFSSTGPMCVVTPIKSIKRKYKLLLNNRKMRESVEIIKSTMFYMIGMCPHLFLLKAYSCS
jgi:hypothetical protein